MLTHRNPEPQKPRRVLVLGARGFISRHLQEWCASAGVECLAVGSAEIDLSAVENAPRLAAVIRPDDAVVMTSTLTPDKGRGYQTLMRNLRMAETVCLALDRAPCAHFVYLSSDAVYDARYLPINEGSTREPADLYGLSHTAREMVFVSALGTKSIPLCILRITSVFGPGDTHNSYGPNRFARSALNKGSIELFGEGEELRSHVFIDDVVRLIGLSLMQCSEGSLNVAASQAVSFKDIAQRIVALAGRPVRVESRPRAVPVVHRTFDNSELIASYPEFRFTSLEEGLAMCMHYEGAGLSSGATPALFTKATT